MQTRAPRASSSSSKVFQRVYNHEKYLARYLVNLSMGSRFLACFRHLFRTPTYMYINRMKNLILSKSYIYLYELTFLFDLFLGCVWCSAGGGLGGRYTVGLDTA